MLYQQDPLEAAFVNGVTTHGQCRGEHCSMHSMSAKLYSLTTCLLAPRLHASLLISVIECIA